MKKVLSNLFILIISIIILTIFIQKIHKIFSKDQIPLFGITTLKISSNSMAPTFYKDDLIIIKKQDEYEIGDIITYKSDEQYLITHRIIEKYKNVFITKGDANNIQDDKNIEKNQIIGKVEYIIRLKEKKAYE